MGDSHAEGGIPAIVVDTGQPIEVEGGEVIINKEASKKYWKELSAINQSAGGGVPIPPPAEFSSDVSRYSKGGKVSISALKEGTKHELEHAETIKEYMREGFTVEEVARSIAKDHLQENPNYYKILNKLKFAKGGEVVCRSCGWHWLESEGGSDTYVCHKCNSDNIKYYKTQKAAKGLSVLPLLQQDPETGMTGIQEMEMLQQQPFNLRGKADFIRRHPEILMLENGGKLSTEKQKLYREWKNLVNMSVSELKAFYDSKEGQEAGLSAKEAREQGIDRGRTSARWVMKMLDTDVAKWTPEMWKWCKKQISFIKRMRGNRGDLYEADGSKTPKHTSLLIWGHNPEKYQKPDSFEGGGWAGLPKPADFYNESQLKQVDDYMKTLNLKKLKVFIDGRLYGIYWVKNVGDKEAVIRYLYGSRISVDDSLAQDIIRTVKPKFGSPETSEKLKEHGGKSADRSFSYAFVNWIAKELGLDKNWVDSHNTIIDLAYSYQGVFKIPQKGDTTAGQYDSNIEVVPFSKGGRTIAQTPAPKKDRIYGSKVNPKGSAKDAKSAKAIQFDDSVISALKSKMSEFNSDNPDKKVSLDTLKAVMRRGMGAYSVSHRPTISGGKPNSRVAWGLARVDAFLRKKGDGKAKKAYVQDDDLLFAKKGMKIPKGNKNGDCYETAGKFALNEIKGLKGHDFVGTPYVVHAEVEGQGAISGIRYGHAWIEDDVMVYDFSNGREIIFPKVLYYHLGKVIQEQPKYFKYTFEEATRKMLDTGHYGSWDLITESGL